MGVIDFVTRRYEFLRVGGLRQVLRNAIKTLLKRKRRAKKRVNTSECYVTGKGASTICYGALHWPKCHYNQDLTSKVVENG